MNMQLVWWFTGVMATIAALRFVWMFFKKMTSKESLTAILEKAEDGLENTAEKLKKRALEKRRKKEEEEQKAQEMKEMTYIIR